MTRYSARPKMTGGAMSRRPTQEIELLKETDAERLDVIATIDVATALHLIRQLSRSIQIVIERGEPKT